jgi:hypothetical protein
MGNRESTVSVRRMLSGAGAVCWETCGVVDAGTGTMGYVLPSASKAFLTHASVESLVEVS